MSPALPVVSGKDTIRALRKSGYRRVSQKGSHVKLRNDEGRTVIVPLHRALARGTLASILRQSGVVSGPVHRTALTVFHWCRTGAQAPDMTPSSGDRRP